ncbi:hypothetical protein BAJUN_01940 [Bajunvirus bajun]|uniref:Uncharacterized protein n=1 Tax=Brevundimonas phage vB_BgoS-Bajun TaxID=2948594 RepID=A0A9E7SS15_9CAUD|nr:hypothetical protein BAJUN_01940 [Brevundimonas phage vB_BgoS-Bajun]
MPHIILERHAYAPELNRAHILRKGRVVAQRPCPGALSIKEARAMLWPRLTQGPARVAFYASHYEGARKWLERAYHGRVSSYAAALAFWRQEAAKLAPGGTATIRTRLVG